MSNDAREALEMDYAAMLDAMDATHGKVNDALRAASLANRQALAALDAPVAAPPKGWCLVRSEEMERLLRDALHATPATTQGREAELREALKRIALKRLDKKPGHYCEARSALDGAIAIAENALATPKPVEAPVQTGSECLHGCVEALDGGRMVVSSEGMDDAWEPCPIHAPKPEATTELCAVCGEGEFTRQHDGTQNGHHPFTPAPKEQRP